MADEIERITDEALWDFANDLADVWNIEDVNPPSLVEMFRDRFVSRFGHGEAQGEPSETQVLAALNMYSGDAHYSNLDIFLDDDVRWMRAALRAAAGVR